MSRVSAVFVLAQLRIPLCRAGEDATGLLRRVSDTYSNLKIYQIHQEGENLFSSELHHSWQKSFTTLAVAGPNKVHFEAKDNIGWYVVISDGRTVWRATPFIGEWSRTGLTGPLNELKNGGAEGDAAINRMKFAMRFYPRLTDDILQAEIVGSEDVEVGGVPFGCTVVRVDYTPPRASVGIQSLTRTYWVDKRRYVILKDESIQRGHLMPSAPLEDAESRWLTRVTFLSLDGSGPESLFTYTPPATLTEVERLERAFPRPAKNLIGKAAPELALKTLDGKQMSLSALHGKAVLLDFWATWCAPCRDQMPKLAKLYNEIKDQNAILLGVDDDQSPEKALAYMGDKGYEWPSLFAGPNSDARQQYKVDGIPTLVLIDKNGVIVAYQVGSGSETEKAIRAALRAQGIQVAE